MNYTSVKSNSRARFSENLAYLNYLTSQEPADLTHQIPLELKIMRGLFYVHLYASLEKTVNDLVETTITLINSKNVKNKHFNMYFNAISLSSKLQSFKDCNQKNFFPKALEIFEEFSSNNTHSLNETVFSSNLQNTWAKTILETTQVFGIKNYTIDPRTRTTIDEIVEKRNAFAHGRESASAIGERFRSDTLRSKMIIVTDFSYELIDTFESYYNTLKYLRPQAKKNYS